MSKSQTKPGTQENAKFKTVPSNGDNQPPMNSTDANIEIKIMSAYSAKKKIANAMPEYSTWNPATISDSPSATSNGARLVSATPDKK